MIGRVVVSAVITKGDEVLLGKKAKGVGPYPDKWLILGGGVNLGEESLEEALRREIREEGGIEIKDIRKIDFDEDRAMKRGELYHFIFCTYRAEYASGNAVPGDDIQELVWVPRKDLSSMDICEPSVKLFKRIGLLP